MVLEANVGARGLREREMLCKRCVRRKWGKCVKGPGACDSKSFFCLFVCLFFCASGGLTFSRKGLRFHVSYVFT